MVIQAALSKWVPAFAGMVAVSDGQGESIGMEEEPHYGVIVARDLMVPMRDGVRLATDVYRPAEDGEPVSGRWPAVLARFGYDKDMRFWIQPLVERLVSEGYAVVVQDIRGRYKSEGDYYHTVSSAEGTDGYDTVEWTAAQNWCDGRVATTGVSLGASVQGAMAMHRPPHLAAMMLEDGPLSYFHNGIRQGGAMELRSVAWAFYPAVDSKEAREDARVREHIEDGMAHLGDLLLGLPLKEGQTPLSLAPRFEAELLDYCTHGEFTDYWRQDCLWYDDMERHADVPTLIRCGWYDSYSLGMSHYFQRLVAEHKSPTQLIYGPWIHGFAAPDVRGRPGLRSGCCGRHGRGAVALLWSVAKGWARRPGRRTGEDLCHGRWRWKTQHRRPPQPRRAVEGRTGVAAGEGGAGQLLPPRRRRPQPGCTGGR